MSQRRGPREMTENEKEHEHTMQQKRGYGETIAGEGAEEMDRMGAVGDISERREKEMRGRHAGPESMERHKSR